MAIGFIMQLHQYFQYHDCLDGVCLYCGYHFSPADLTSRNSCVTFSRVCHRYCLAFGTVYNGQPSLKGSEILRSHMGAGEVETIVQMQYMPSGTEACQQKFCLSLSELDIRFSKIIALRSWFCIIFLFQRESVHRKGRRNNSIKKESRGIAATCRYE